MSDSEQMQYVILTHDKSLIVNISGRITYQASKKFIDISSKIEDFHRTIEVRLVDVIFIDSVGVGMLIVLAEHARTKGCAARLTGVTGQVERVFKSTELLGLIDWDRDLICFENDNLSD